MKYLRVFNSNNELEETFPSDDGEIPDNLPEVFVFTILENNLLGYYENIYSWRLYSLNGSIEPERNNRLLNI